MKNSKMTVMKRIFFAFSILALLLSCTGETATQEKKSTTGFEIKDLNTASPDCDQYVLMSTSHGDVKIKLYRERLENTLLSVIRDLSLPESTPIIMGELGEFVGRYRDGACSRYTEINAIMHEFASDNKNVAVASADGLTCKEDGIHFNSASYRVFGKRYFDEYLKLRGQE